MNPQELLVKPISCVIQAIQRKPVRAAQIERLPFHSFLFR